MKKNEILTDSNDDLKRRFRKNLPELLSIAQESENITSFKEKLSQYISCLATNNEDTARHLQRLIQFDGTVVYELSTATDMKIYTITDLYHFLLSEPDNMLPADLYLDLYNQFLKLKYNKPDIKPDQMQMKLWMKRWSHGTEPEIIEMRKNNKKRIINLLINKIENRHSLQSRYLFPENTSREEKYEMVEKWWNESRFHLNMAIKSPTELNKFLNNTLSDETFRLLMQAKKKDMPFFITPYYLSLLNVDPEGYDDEAIRSYILYSEELIRNYGNIVAWEREDKVEQGKPNAAGWLLPDGNNIHRRYPEVAILIPDSIGRACGGLCASCQRMYDFQSKRLNFEFENLKPKETWPKKLRRLMTYFEEDKQLRDILITGGDALMSQNKTLRNILYEVYKMAERKRKANMFRSENDKYAEIQRIRLGSRLLAYLPMRINDELLDILKEFKERGKEAGIKQFIIQTHFQSPLEVTPEACEAIRKLLSTGWIITNQLVYNIAASRRGHTAKLRRILNEQGVICYYTFTVKGFDENYAVFTPNSRSVQEKEEEKIRGVLTTGQEQELMELLSGKIYNKEVLRTFLKKNKLPFLATDRNVLNLPGIGKSMTFKTVGMTSDGRRILSFSHDSERRHSPVIHQMDKVYIVENKSVAAYLRQLEHLGENVNHYQSIWYYTEEKTEPRFDFYNYPDYEFSITDEINNLGC